MKWLIAVSLIIPYIFLSVALAGLLPLPWVFNQATIQKLLVTTKVYDRAVAIAIQQWQQVVKEQGHQETLFAKTVATHAAQILTKSWIEKNSSQIVADTFQTIDTGKYKPLTLDMSELKTNYLQVLKNSPVGPQIPHLETQLPDTVPLAQVSGVSDEEVKSNLLQLKLLGDRIPVILGILGSLLVLVVGVLYYSLPRSLVWRSLAIGTTLSGVIILGWAAFVQYQVLSVARIDMAMEQGSIWSGLMWILATALLEQIANGGQWRE